MRNRRQSGCVTESRSGFGPGKESGPRKDTGSPWLRVLVCLTSGKDLLPTLTGSNKKFNSGPKSIMASKDKFRRSH
ncbi:hypothetical protein R1sor_020437 [Riccia sorocarpa]|uniref:Uncharacterized protein n=1 Tax=Riccia sorocarpa TaxID=122646 RepID=A0ABD3IJ26_9MARC